MKEIIVEPSFLPWTEMIPEISMDAIKEGKQEVYVEYKTTLSRIWYPIKDTYTAPNGRNYLFSYEVKDRSITFDAEIVEVEARYSDCPVNFKVILEYRNKGTLPVYI